MKRPALIIFLFALIGVTPLFLTVERAQAGNEDSLTVVREGAAKAVIVVPAEPSESKKTPNWTLWTNDKGSAERNAEIGHSGTASLSLNNMKQGGVYQVIDVKPGPVTAQLYYYTAAAGEGKIRIGMNLRDADNQNLSTLQSQLISLSATAGEWAAIGMQGTIPAQIGNKAVTKAQVWITVESGEGIQVLADDYLVYQEDANRNLLKNPGFEEIASPLAAPLVEYVKKSAGVELPVVAGQPSDGDGAAIYLGFSRAEDEAAHHALLHDMNEQGFIIDSQEDTVTIVGNTPQATEFGIYEFLERYVGVRWLMPGPDGEEVPQRSSITIPRELVREEPATISRHFFGTEGPASFTEWAVRNRMDNNIQFHHNMNNLFDPKVFADHPEYYAGGVVPSHPWNWQPCFNDATAEAAIRRIDEYFSANPQASSYSLGINDSINYCETPGHPDYPTRTNSVGNLHRSDLYYRWVNKIAEGVSEKYPDKYFGLLSYREMYDPPMNDDGTPLKLHPRVIPYITDDRMSWTDEPIGAAGKQHTENWLQSASSLGWYEYLYGSPYNVPRIYLHKMAENYRYGDEHGVIGHVAELYPNFGEGPKPWVSAKLQWNPNQDVDQLLQQWYTSAVGEEAAAYLRQYYELWEGFWTTRIFGSSWYKEWKERPGRSNYLNLFDQSYLKEVARVDIAESRRLLELAVAHAGTEKQKVRAGLLLRAFEFYEASALSYPQIGAIDPPKTEQEALAMLEVIARSYEMGNKRGQLINEFAKHPALHLPLKPPTYGGEWNGVQRVWFDGLMKYVIAEPANGPVRMRVDQFLAELPEDIRRQYVEQIPDLTKLAATAVKTAATKAELLQAPDFSQGPWAEAKPFDEFLIMDSYKLPPALTTVYLLWDDENLYVGYENKDNDLSKMIVSNDAPNGWWRSNGDDSVETYVTADLHGTYSGYFTNPQGVKFVYSKAPDSSPKPDTDANWEASASIGNDRWNVVQVIPFSSIGVNPEEIQELQGFFFRNYHGQSAFLSWGGAAPWKAQSFRPIHLERQGQPPTAVVTYSSTAATHDHVIATITPSKPVTITNNGGADSYTFLMNGSFTFEFVDAAGRKGTATATVTNIIANSTGAPGKPVLSSNLGFVTGIQDGSYTVSMDMWWGDNGKIYKLYENDSLIDTQVLADKAPNAQSVATSIANKKNGVYRYYAELINEHGITRSDTLTVTVTQAAPGKPVLSSDNWNGGSHFNLYMNMWWGTNGTTYRLYENGVLIETKLLTANSPSAQTAVTAIRDKNTGIYKYQCELINDAGSAFSEPIIVRVVK
ncbi:DUF4838 domain-containing protein [Paenibacillus sp. GCM10027626]|uniref:DUF4838 domain-containing protein n=1 Tax=Paenibacillus sp. GCM10027626 TaxID=3273411 RepID=UPI003629633E